MLDDEQRHLGVGSAISTPGQWDTVLYAASKVVQSSKKGTIYALFHHIAVQHCCTAVLHSQYGQKNNDVAKDLELQLFTAAERDRSSIKSKYTSDVYDVLID